MASEPLSRREDPQRKAGNQNQQMSDNPLGAIFGLIFLGLCIALYFLPWIIAHNRGHPRRESIAVLNLLLGWTFVGCVIALCWAVAVPEKAKPKDSVPLAPVDNAWSALAAAQTASIKPPSARRIWLRIRGALAGLFTPEQIATRLDEGRIVPARTLASLDSRNWRPFEDVIDIGETRRPAG